MNNCREINLAGTWNFSLLTQEPSQALLEGSYADTIALPSTVSGRGKSPLTGEKSAGYLVDPRAFQGYAVYDTEIAFTPDPQRDVFLYLEKTRVSTLYINGRKVGRQDSLCTPHNYDITNFLKGDKLHITLVIDNLTCPVPGGHMTSPDTQTNWLGIVGKIVLTEKPKLRPENVRITGDISAKRLHLSGRLLGTDTLEVSVSVQETFSCGKSSSKEILGQQTLTLQASKEDAFSCALDIPKMQLWEEHTPNVGTVQLSYGGYTQTLPFGLRSFEAKGTTLTVNDNPIFLRGKHDGMLFPMTGVAPTDVDSWLKVMGTAKEYGINHYRFHTCCPPEAAFEAADQLGIYLEPELPFWGTVEDPVTPGQEYLIQEGFRILDTFGNHPSFFALSLGNELWGSQTVLDKILADYKAYDNRHLYTQGSNNFQFVPAVLDHEDFFVGVRFSKERLFRGSYAMCDAPLGHIQTDAPGSDYTYDAHIRPTAVAGGDEATAGQTMEIQYGTGVKTVELTQGGEFIPQVPVVSHEIGQYFMYPDYDEIAKYTGVLKPTNLEIFKERLEAAGLSHLAKDYFEASGHFAADCYKLELETALRSKELSGFQLLDLQDFTGQGTALVGILNSFMESKGILSAKEWRRFCNDRVLLGCLPGFVYAAGAEVPLKVKLFTYAGASEVNPTAEIALHCGKEVLSKAEITLAGTVQDGVYDLGSTTLALPSLDNPRCLELTLSLKGAPEIQNQYSLWVYPDEDTMDLYNAPEICTDESEAQKRLARGENVLLLPRIEALANPPVKGETPSYVAGTYCTDFWNYPMFRSISESVGRPEPVGTLGLLVDTNHPALKDFPCVHYSTPQWYDIVTDAPVKILDGSGITPMVRTIDNCERNHSLGLIWEEKKGDATMLVCTSPLDLKRESLPCRQLLKSLLAYLR